MLYCSSILATAFFPYRYLPRYVGKIHTRLSVQWFIIATVIYWLFPWPGRHQWDAFMTASVLVHHAQARWEHFLFFAHPLVIPLTFPFYWIYGDPLGATVLREVIAGGGVVALAATVVYCITQSQRWSAFAALLLITAVSRWRLATSGEEKEIALFFGGLYWSLYLNFRGIIAFQETANHPPKRARQGWFLALLGALSVLVHINNCLLIIATFLTSFCDTSTGTWRWRRWTVAMRASLLLSALFFVFTVIFLGIVAIIATGRTSPLAVFVYYTEYHRSGEFLQIPRTIQQWREHLLGATQGFYEYWCGELWTSVSWFTCIATIVAHLVILVRALRAQKVLVQFWLIWAVLLLTHGFIFQPWDPESWSPIALSSVVIVTIALRSNGKKSLFSVIAALVLLGVTSVANIVEQRQIHHEQAQLTQQIPTRKRFTIWGDLAIQISQSLEPSATLLVDDRLLASYFMIYTQRRVIVAPLLNYSPEQLRSELHFTALSMLFYTPTQSRTQLRQAILAQQPVYLLTTEPVPLANVREFSGTNLRLGRLRAWQL